MPMTEKCSLDRPSGRAFWWTPTLWAASGSLPVRPVPVSDFPELDEDCWFSGRAPSVREVAEHARRIERADLAHPVILSAAGELMDGGHRLAKAWLLGLKHVDAVRFAVDPEPDWVES
ncbi:ParB/RepB/Spo0J family partition protein [Lapillicoccus jejuensis]|uniref:ParB-like nuclease family protein n=1 Tax=Lapillicoccus jejuensis TaxID=402171 RepID=A0A542DYQ9_9MICO|nr:ParB/RepB/Spo0J family partition protein [Lapillicoccus jejuensis]TQJ08064.1 hypothetical protein FB458_1143 [Lapillicoccus jejuensis]